MTFDLDDLAATDTAELEIKSRDGTPTGWKWTIAGPGHPKTVELSARLSQMANKRIKAQETARVNGKKWTPDDEPADAAMRRNAQTIAARVLGWTPITMGGKELPFTEENLVSLLLDPKRGDTLVSQVAEFLADERAFTKRAQID